MGDMIQMRMTWDQATEHCDQVRKGQSTIYEHLLVLHDAEGWRTLGHESWAQCLEVEFGWNLRDGKRRLTGARIMGLLVDHATIKDAYVDALDPIKDLRKKAHAYKEVVAQAKLEGQPLTAKSIKEYVKTLPPEPVDVVSVPVEDPKIVRDELGFVVTGAPALEAFTRRGEVDEAYSDATKLGGKLHRLYESPIMAAHVNAEAVSELCKRLKATIRYGRAHCVCEICDGTGQDCVDALCRAGYKIKAHMDTEPITMGQADLLKAKGYDTTGWTKSQASGKIDQLAAAEGWAKKKPEKKKPPVEEIEDF